MTSPWLRDYALEELGSEIRKRSHSQHSPQHNADYDNNEPPPPSEFSSTRKDHSRLVKILARGQGGGRLASGNNVDVNANSNANANGGSSLGNDWWNAKRRGKSPNLAKHTNAWLLISDGSHCARFYLTVGSLHQIFDWDNRNNNDDILFGRGCCVLLKQYSFELFGGTGIDFNDDDDNSNDNNTNTNTTEKISLVFKVSALEPKPGFNHHANKNDNNNSNSYTTIRPIMEEIDVLYGLQFLQLARQRQQQQRRHSITSGGDNITHNGTVDNNRDASSSIARDWDIAFGRLSKGLLSTSASASISTLPLPSTTSTPGGATTVTDENILEYAEKISSTDEAISDWEMAKKRYGIISSAVDDDDNTVRNNEIEHNESNTQENGEVQTVKTTATMTYSRKQSRERNSQGSDEDNDEQEEDYSRLFIQNVLATQEEKEVESDHEDEAKEEEEDKSKSDKSTEEEHDDDQISDVEELLLPDTQPPILPRKSHNDDDDDDGIQYNKNPNKAMCQKQSSVDDGRKSDGYRIRTTLNARRKRHRESDSESAGTISSNSTLDEATTTGGMYRGLRGSTRNTGKQQQYQYQYQKSTSSTGIWESVRAQLFEPGRTVVYCVPASQVPPIGNDDSGDRSGDDKNNDGYNYDNEMLPATPKNQSTKAFISGSRGRATISTPDPSSGAYYRKYGLSRWVSRNTIDDDEDETANETTAYRKFRRDA